MSDIFQTVHDIILDIFPDIKKNAKHEKEDIIIYEIDYQYTIIAHKKQEDLFLSVSLPENEEATITRAMTLCGQIMNKENIRSNFATMSNIDQDGKKYITIYSYTNDLEYSSIRTIISCLAKCLQALSGNKNI